MQEIVQRGCKQKGVLPGGLKVERRAPELFQKLFKNALKGPSKDPLEIMDWVNLYALAVNEENAAGGKIVTAPTNGAAGIIPAVLHYYSNFHAEASQDGIRRFLLLPVELVSTNSTLQSLSRGRMPRRSWRCLLYGGWASTSWEAPLTRLKMLQK